MRNKPAFTDAQWTAFCSDVRKIFAEHFDEIANANGIAGTKPHVGKNEVCFNGIEDDAHETCVVRRNHTNFDFCKTARKPYDRVVVKVYKLVKKYLPETILSSDGGPAVFSDVVVVEAPSGKLLTYSAGSHKVNVGDIVLLPSLSRYGNGYDWTAEVVATKSDYDGELKEILEVVQRGVGGEDAGPLDHLDPDDQISTEEEIASAIHEKYELSEDASADIARLALLIVAKRLGLK